MSAFRAYLVERQGEHVEHGVRSLEDADLPAGEVTVRVAWSGINYKDGLASKATRGVANVSPLVPGVDLAGEVVASDAESIPVGAQVIAHGYDIGTDRFGGFAEVARVPEGYVVPLPEGVSAREAMAIGTAGFTAAQSVQLLEAYGLVPGQGPVLVTGGTGGVGSIAVAILAALGYEVTASTGKEAEHDFLRRLGASSILSRDEVAAPTKRMLESERWAGAVDAVGGSTTAAILKSTRKGGAVALSGNIGGAAIETTVMPFILRGVALLGVDSAWMPLDQRRALWERLAGDLRPAHLDEIAGDEVDLDGLQAALDRILAGGARGRTLVRLG